MTGQQTVFVVDDDHHARESVCALARSMGVQVRNFESAESFLEQYDDSPGCLVTDYRMRGMNGLELQESLIQQGNPLPMIIVTAFARTSLTVQAIKNGAITLLDKPYDDDNLWQAIRAALQQDEERRQMSEEDRQTRCRLESLNDKELPVLELMMQGESNKSMAEKLSVSLRTIENRRRKIFSKLGVETIAELVALVLKVRDAA